MKDELTTSDAATESCDHIPADGLLIGFFGHDGTVLGLNEAMADTLEFQAEDLIGSEWTRFSDQTRFPAAIVPVLQNYLSKGEAVSAILPYDTLSGTRFWGHSITAPISGGFCVLILRPSPSNVSVMRSVYEEVSDRIGKTAPTPETCIRHIEEGLANAGFGSYQKFCGLALSRDFTEWRNAAQREMLPQERHFDAIITASKALQAEVSKLQSAFSAIYTITYNLRIIASRVEPSGGALTKISENYQSMSNEFRDWLDNYTSDTVRTDSELRGAVRVTQFYHLAARLQQEAPDRSGRILCADGLDPAQTLKEVAERGLALADKSTQIIRERATSIFNISSGVRDMKRLLTGLQSTTMLCKTEAEKLATPHASLGEIVGQLRKFQQVIHDQIEVIEQQARAISDHAETLLHLPAGR